jgi:RimJ/RimL family protein N-acetyltransferase
MTGSSPSVDTRPLPEVVLRPLTILDRVRIRQWMRDPTVIHNTVVVPEADYGDVDLYDAAMADDYLRSLMHDRDRRSFAIEWRGEHVGNVGLKGHHPNQPTCECFIELGHAPARGHGVAHQAMSLLLHHAFVDLQLKAVSLGVFDFNKPARKLYDRLGFWVTQSLGVHHARGQQHNVVGMTMTRDAWEAAHKARQLGSNTIAPAGKK